MPKNTDLMPDSGNASIDARVISLFKRRRMSDNALNTIELRILGSLIEKEATTPEYYPLTLNALVNACNQKSNRWPVSSHSEDEVAEGLRVLRTHRYAAEVSGSGMRVSKFAQRFTETLNLGRRETAILCVLMLRGPQTLGEIKDRSERIHSFADLEEVEGVLQKLQERGMSIQLPKMPGQKESRFAQLLGGPVTQEANIEVASHFLDRNAPDRIGVLEAEVTKLRLELDELRQKLDAVL